MAFCLPGLGFLTEIFRSPFNDSRNCLDYANYLHGSRSIFYCVVFLCHFRMDMPIDKESEEKLMNMEEAREIVGQFKDAPNIFEKVNSNTKAYFIAEGFLEGHAYAMKQVEPLIETLESHKKRWGHTNHFDDIQAAWGKCSLCEALAIFREREENKP
jgi:hypothetical protein